MSLGKQNTTNGTSQLQRLHPALAPASVLFSGLSTRDLLTYTYGLAREIHFYDMQNLPVGNWQQFLDYFLKDTVSGTMKTEAEIQSIINRKKDFDPHLGLFLVFLYLFEHLQADMNAITQRHLDFYFDETLGIRRNAAKPDQVHVIFELARNASQELLKAGTALDAGRAVYELDRDVVVHSAKIAFIRSLYVDTIRNSRRFYAAMVANSADGAGASFVTEYPVWSAFGEPQRDKPRNQGTMADAELGFAFASPQLLLREGTREITLRIAVEAPAGYSPERQLGNAFGATLSGEKGWIQPSRVVSRIEQSGSAFFLLVQLTLDPILPAVVGYKNEVLKVGFTTTQPVVRLLLRPQARAYETLHPLQLTAIDIEVAVSGMSGFTLSNDQGPIDPGKPFLPFGSQPNIGASFYIVSEEVFSKRLDKLELQIQWHNLPNLSSLSNNLGRYYQSYIGNAASLNNGSFEAIAQFAYRGKNYQVNQRERLFNSNNPSNEHTITISSNQILSALSSSGIDYIRQPEPQSFLGDTKIKHFSLSLSAPNRNNLQAFGHPNYTMLMTAAVLAQATQSNPLPPPPLPNSPYTPEIKTLGLSYRSRHLTTINSSSQYDTVYQIGPFGWKHVGAEDSDRFLLPQIHSEGTMFLGLTEFRPPSTINLLFQLAEGTAKAGFQLPSRSIRWYYLSNDNWRPLPSENLITENTLNFRQSGLISLLIPGDASQQHSLMPGGAHWIKAEISSGAAGTNQVIAIHEQAALASLRTVHSEVSSQNSHLETPLPAASIKGLLQKKTAIKKVHQPFSSFNGIPSEEGSIYYARASERLRHKNRAVAAWDYERLILESFPSIYKVYCLHHVRGFDYQAPGAVTLVVVPDLRERNIANPLKPAASTTLLGNIRDLLRRLGMSTHVDLWVENPVYEEILLDFQVQFKTGIDSGFFARLLNEDLVRFLSPWANSDSNAPDIQFGGKIYKSDLMAFVDSREYVENITRFKLFQITPPGLPPYRGIGFMQIGTSFSIADTPEFNIGSMAIGDNFIIGRERDVAEANSPKSILVSAPTHRIREFSDTRQVCEGFSGLGIGLMTVGLDFEIE